MMDGIGHGRFRRARVRRPAWGGPLPFTSLEAEPVSRLFLSHSSSDNTEAVGLADWLAAAGWNDVFLDLAPDRGITAGERWERALTEAASRCEAVLFLVSRAWLDSRWCQRELMLAHRLNKRLFGVLIETFDPTELPPDLSGAWQLVDLASGRDHEVFQVTHPRTHQESHATFSREGLRRLRIGLMKAGLDPRFFAWPPKYDPNRPPYRGLRPLEAEDAGIFFGRDAPIVDALDQLRGLREASPPRLMIILGASGSGKSSFLRAGLLARMARDDRNFLPLPVIRPERAAIAGENGLLRALGSALRAAGIDVPRTRLWDAVGNPATLRPLLRELVEKSTLTPVDADAAAKPPTLVISIDQGEELFRAEGRDEAQLLLEVLGTLLSGDAPAVIVLIAIRSDSYIELQETEPLVDLRKLPFDLGPMPTGSYAEVIKGPAMRLEAATRPLRIEEGLVGALLSDIEAGGGKDALPLLSFTLERLYLEHEGSGWLTVADYERLGGIKGSIEEAVERALKMADTDPTVPSDRAARLALVRRGVIPWLAGIDPDTGTPRRRTALVAEIPVECLPLLKNLVEQRLLATDVAATGETTIEPAHEALLRQWSLLEGWLADDAALLAVLEGLRRAAHDWRASDNSSAWLTHSGDRLRAAEQLSQRPDLVARLDSTDHKYLAACRTLEDENLAAQERYRQAELQAAKDRQEAAERLASAETTAKEQAEARAKEALSHTEVLRKRSRILRIVLAATLAVAAAAVYGFVSANTATKRADARSREAIALKLTSQGLSMLADVQGGGDVRALQQFVAAPRVDPTADTGALLMGLIERRDTIKIIQTPGAVRRVALSPDGTRIVSGSLDGTLRLWDAKSGNQIGDPFKGHADAVESVAFSRDGRRIVSGSDDKTARVWNADTHVEIGNPLRGHTDPVESVEFSPDGRLIVSGSKDTTVRLWNADTDLQVGDALRGHSDWVNCVTFSPNGQEILSGSDDKTLRLWDVNSHLQVGDSFNGHTNWVDSAVFSADGRSIVSGGWDDTLRVWDPNTHKELGDPFKGHTGAVESVAFSRDGQRIVSGSHDATVRLWDPHAGKQIGDPFTGHTSGVSSVMFSPDGHRIFSGSVDTTVRSWDADTAPLTGHTGAATSVAYSPDGKLIVSGSADGTLRLWDTHTRRQVGPALNGSTDKVNSVAFSRDGNLVVSGGDDKSVRLWNAQTHAQIAEFVGHDKKVNSVAFSPDGNLAVSGSDDKSVRLWDTHTRRQVGQLNGNEDLVAGVAFNPNGNRVASAGYDHSVRLWDVHTLQPVAQLNGHTSNVSSVAFSPDGRLIVSGSADNTLRLWHADGSFLRQLTGPTATVTSVAFSPDSQWIVSGSSDQTLRLWSADTGQQIGQPFTGHTDKVNGVAFSPGGRQIVSASADTALRLWDVPPASTWSEMLCDKLTTNMNRGQWSQWVSPDIPYYDEVCHGLPLAPETP